jgi:transcriptional regulator with XRE-family HTH domain
MKRGRKQKLTRSQMLEIHEMYAVKSDPLGGWSVAQIAKYMGCSSATVNKVLAGKYEPYDHDPRPLEARIAGFKAARDIVWGLCGTLRPQGVKLESLSDADRRLFRGAFRAGNKLSDRIDNTYREFGVKDPELSIFDALEIRNDNDTN